MKKILLFGGAFDPIQNGHLNMARRVKEALNIDETIFILSKNPRWKNTPTPVEHRLAMMKVATESFEDTFISLFEVESLATVNYSIDTVRHYKEVYPDCELYFLIGYDQVDQFHMWEEPLELSKLAHIVTYIRPKYELNHENVKKYNILLVEGPTFEVSSTLVRKLQSLDAPLEVLHYILEHELYFTKRLKDFFSIHRYLHAVSVADLTFEIARANGLDGSKAYIAGLLHDVAKEMDYPTSSHILQSFYPLHEDFPPFSIHQYVGAIIAEQEFHILDEEILDAIRYHASGKPDMNWLGKILYTADKIEPRRGFDSKEFIELAKKNYHEGFVAVLRANYEYHKEKNKPFVCNLTEQCMNFYLGGKNEK